MQSAQKIEEIALITVSSKGIGIAFFLLLAKHGHNIFIYDKINDDAVIALIKKRQDLSALCCALSRGLQRSASA